MLIEDLARSASVGKQTDIILLDFSKTFDKVITANFCESCINTAFADMCWIGSELSLGVDPSG